MQFEVTAKIPNATIIHHVDELGGFFATRGRRIFHQKGLEQKPIAAFPHSYPRDLFLFSRPTARAMRSDKCNIYVNRFGKILGIRGGWVYAIEQGSANLLFRIQGDCVLHRSICEDENGDIYFGEYFMNPERKPVRVWRVSSDLKTWQVAYQFDNIRHIHGVYRDPYQKSFFWITVGDFKGECFIYRTDNRFDLFETFGNGSQVWRAVNLFFTEDYVSWLTDSNLEPNHACRLKRKDGKLEIGQSVDASVWYGCTTREKIYLAFTTIERGPAILSNESSILASSDAFNWQKIYAFKKDFWKPVQVFKYGVISSPSGTMENKRLFLSGEGLVGLDGISITARLV